MKRSTCDGEIMCNKVVEASEGMLVVIWLGIYCELTLLRIPGSLCRLQSSPKALSMIGERLRDAVLSEDAKVLISVCIKETPIIP